MLTLNSHYMRISLCTIAVHWISQRGGKMIISAERPFAFPQWFAPRLNGPFGRGD